MKEYTMEQPEFVFTGVIFQEENGYTALCPDTDVASQSDSIPEAKAALLEAVTLYLETALENNLPWLRPVPRDEDPRYDCGRVLDVVKMRDFVMRKQHQIENFEIKGDKNETPESDCDVSVESIVVERGDASTGRVERDGAAAAA